MCAEACYCSLAAVAAVRFLRTRAIVGFAKMPLQASIFASWYN